MLVSGRAAVYKWDGSVICTRPKEACISCIADLGDVSKASVHTKKND